jgi:hypothetical protein
MTDEMKKPPEKQSRGALVLGLILVMVGAGIALSEFTAISESFVLPALGIAFLVAAFLTRQYGFVVPGCILTGLGAGVVAQDVMVDEPGWPVVLGLGIGFIGIWVIDELLTRTVPRGGRWWPLIPGSILVAVGVMLSLGENAQQYTPYVGAAVLIVIGLIIIVRAITGGRGTRAT